MSLRIAFAGASGTGKTTLVQKMNEGLRLPVCPVGSRSVSAAMGFASPYDVDAAGERATFQRRLLREKASWETSHQDFITDRTHFDNLAYTAMHAPAALDMGFLTEVIQAAQAYTHVFFLPVEVPSDFISTASNNARIDNLTYHMVYSTLLRGLLERHCKRLTVVRHRDADRLLGLWKEATP